MTGLEVGSMAIGIKLGLDQAQYSELGSSSIKTGSFHL